MFQVKQITTDARQRQTIVLPDGTSFDLVLYFSLSQIGWFITELTYVTATSSFSVKGLRITVSPNMLQQWKNLIPFGLACFSTANREPTQKGDFASGAAILYILTAEEVAAYTALLAGE